MVPNLKLPAQLHKHVPATIAAIAQAACEPARTKFGLCGNFRIAICGASNALALESVFESAQHYATQHWPSYTGLPAYPVPGDGHFPAIAYLLAKNDRAQWDHSSYGSKRRAYCLYLIKVLSEAEVQDA